MDTTRSCESSDRYRKQKENGGLYQTDPELVKGETMLNVTLAQPYGGALTFDIRALWSNFGRIANAAPCLTKASAQ